MTIVRRIRIVADSCPRRRKNCNTCPLCEGIEYNRVYCELNKLKRKAKR